MPTSLKEKYCIVGVGETEYSQASGRTTRAMGVEVVKKAMDDAGLKASDVDGIVCYHSNDSTPTTLIAGTLGIRPNFYLDVTGGGGTSGGLVTTALAAMEAGLCKTVAVFRSMNGYSQTRIGGTGPRAAAPITGEGVMTRPYGYMSPAQSFAFTFMRHLYEFGTKPSQVAMVKVVHTRHASNNPKAFLKKRVTVDEVLNSRWIVKPVHLLDCCLETDNATCIIVAPAERARSLRQKPIYIMGGSGPVNKLGGQDLHYQHGPITRVQGYYVKDIVFPMAGVTPEDIDVTGSYDAFTWTTLLQLEDYGFCKKGEGGDYVSSGIIELGGKRPNNTSGGQLCEGYTHGINLVIELTRQLRGQVDDYCPGWREGKHTYDYSEGHCRAVKDPEIGMFMGWGSPGAGNSLILRR
ncbi:MAG: hypothetical protein HYY00_03300 [Chloroflexi bacterium]|nr:hypothetical protein [Chloroflexota bacterium]